ncbi:uncharacterized protein TNCT_578251 [Trichonephila clavata]|uniref:Uncharacterized protein n=1 Tax=Trichonephila clavata TaxID=2740835 RepID=A0A8X6FII7_TRICU|nr:uncharacterized protein TNCT_578251 [Trichonephila clavata]
MEKFGYIITDPFCEREYFYIHNVLYVDIVSVHIHRNTDEPLKIVYFKILTNSEIVRFLHEEQTEKKRFGFCQLTRCNPTEKFRVYSSLKVLFENILEPVLASKQISWSDVPDSPNFEAKFAYFHVLNSIKHKPAKKRLVRSERESDVESINDEDDRNSLFDSKKK